MGLSWHLLRDCNIGVSTDAKSKKQNTRMKKEHIPGGLQAAHRESLFDLF